MASPQVPRTNLGSQGLEVSMQGLGCMGMSGIYGGPKPEDEMIKLIHHAVDSGITFLDTSDNYGPFLNEILLGKALKGIRHKVQLATKFGICFKDGQVEFRGDPPYVRSACDASLKRLDVDCIDLYYQHRVDTRVPIEVTVGEMKKLVQEGKVRYLGLSEACASTIRRAHAIHPITAVQLEWSLWTRDVEKDIIPTCRLLRILSAHTCFRSTDMQVFPCLKFSSRAVFSSVTRELGIGIVAYSPLGRGFFSAGSKVLQGLADNDIRKYAQPRLKGENLEKNQLLFDGLNGLAARKGCTPGQLALAWVQHQGDDVVPIPGTTKLKNLDENISALKVKLTMEDLQEIEMLFHEDAVAGERFPPAMDAWTFYNSETPPLLSWQAS